jgi:hypothetical protein
MTTQRSLPLRIGGPLALAISFLLVLIVTVALAQVNRRGMSVGEWDPITLAALAAPFALLALAGVRDWAAWTIAIAATGAVWAWVVYDVSLHEGVNFAFPLVVWLAAPLLISGASLTAAGIRGHIAWAHDED